MFFRQPLELLCKCLALVAHCFCMALLQFRHKETMEFSDALSKNYKKHLSRLWFPTLVPKTMKGRLLLAVDRILIPLYWFTIFDLRFLIYCIRKSKIVIRQFLFCFALIVLIDDTTIESISFTSFFSNSILSEATNPLSSQISNQ